MEGKSRIGEVRAVESSRRRDQHLGEDLRASPAQTVVDGEACGDSPGVLCVERRLLVGDAGVAGLLDSLTALGTRILEIKKKRAAEVGGTAWAGAGRYEAAVGALHGVGAEAIASACWRCVVQETGGVSEDVASPVQSRRRSGHYGRRGCLAAELEEYVLAVDDGEVVLEVDVVEASLCSAGPKEERLAKAEGREESDAGIGDSRAVDGRARPRLVSVGQVRFVQFAVADS